MIENGSCSKVRDLQNLHHPQQAPPSFLMEILQLNVAGSVGKAWDLRVEVRKLGSSPLT